MRVSRHPRRRPLRSPRALVVTLTAALAGVLGGAAFADVASPAASAWAQEGVGDPLADTVTPVPTLTPSLQASESPSPSEETVSTVTPSGAVPADVEATDPEATDPEATDPESKRPESTQPETASTSGAPEDGPAEESEPGAGETSTAESASPEGEEAPESQPADVAPLAVDLSDIAATSSAVVVRVSGPRSPVDPTEVEGFAGVTLQLFTGFSTGPVAPADFGTAGNSLCVSDADGDCVFEVPDTQCDISFAGTCLSGGDNHNARFWIVPDDVAGVTPVGFYANPTVVTDNGAVIEYPGRTAQLDAGEVYDYVYAFSVNNPPVTERCGVVPLRVGFVVDLSSSVAPSLTTLHDAMSGFVDTLAGTDAEVALYTFSDASPALYAGPNLAPVALGGVGSPSYLAVMAAIDAMYAGGGTNWDDGIYAAASVGGESKAFDLVIMLTDGNPTLSMTGGNGGSTTPAVVSEAILSANALKEKGTRILTLGIGNGLAGDPSNLAATSGPIPFTGGDPLTADYFQTGWETLDETLAAIAQGVSCQTALTVTKLAQAADDDDAAPADDWEFTVTAQDSDSTPLVVNPTPTQVTATTPAGPGTAQWTIQHTQPDATGALTITEGTPPVAGEWDLTDAVCSVNNVPVVPQVTGDVVTLTGVPNHATVDCVITNTEQTTPPTTEPPTTEPPTTEPPTTEPPTTEPPTTEPPTTEPPTTEPPTTEPPTTEPPTTEPPTTDGPTTDTPTSDGPTSEAPTSGTPTTPSGTSTTSGGGGLPSTGADDPTSLLATAAALCLLGGVVWLRARRRSAMDD